MSCAYLQFVFTSHSRTLLILTIHHWFFYSFYLNQVHYVHCLQKLQETRPVGIGIRAIKEAESGASQVQTLPGLQSDFKAACLHKLLFFKSNNNK